MPGRPVADAFPDAARFITGNLPLRSVPGLDPLRLHLAGPSSQLHRLTQGDGPAPYWAYLWAGGNVLARYLRAYPQLVAGKRVLDLGAGSGLAAIVSAMLDAREVIASETDAHARTAIALNAAANGVTLEILGDSLLSGDPLPVDVVLAGDVFYEPALAARSLSFLRRCEAAGQGVLIGDPDRAPLPREELEPIYNADVPDFGTGEGMVPAAVYRLRR